MCVTLAPLWCSFISFFSAFQQIDIKEATDPDTGFIMLRMFGVTEAWSDLLATQLID